MAKSFFIKFRCVFFLAVRRGKIHNYNNLSKKLLIAMQIDAAYKNAGLLTCFRRIYEEFKKTHKNLLTASRKKCIIFMLYLFAEILLRQ